MGPIDEGVLHVIQSSVGWLIGLEGEFVRELYADVTALITTPAGNLWGVCQRMVQSVLWVPTTGQPPEVVAETLRRVGAMNQTDGFPETQYVNVAHALVRAVRDLSGNSWSTSTGSAWISYFLWLRPHLIAGARQVTARQAAAEHEAARQATARLEAAREAAARLEAARAEAASQNWLGRPTPPTPEVDLETAATLLDDDDDDEDEDAGYGQIMVSMTRNNRRGRQQHPG
jgi:hypothetical protein